ncbi:MAG TPA: hypothetical protein VII92_05595, partial [Anaerolineae bacterium]
MKTFAVSPGQPPLRASTNSTIKINNAAYCAPRRSVIQPDTWRRLTRSALTANGDLFDLEALEIAAAQARLGANTNVI